MTVHLKTPPAGCTPIHVVDRASFDPALAQAAPHKRQWLAAIGFKGVPDSHDLVPAADGRLAAVWAGVHDAAHPCALSALPMALPGGRYRLDGAGLALDAEAAALSWALGSHARLIVSSVDERASTSARTAGPLPRASRWASAASMCAGAIQRLGRAPAAAFCSSTSPRPSRWSSNPGLVSGT